MINTIRNIFGMGPAVDYKALIEQGALILDVRSTGEFKGGHAKGAVNVPLDRLSDFIKKQKDKNQVIITCCASGMRSGSAKSALKNAGFENVYNGGPWQNVNL